MLISLAIAAIICGALLYLANLLLSGVVDARFLKAANVLVVLAFALYALGQLTGRHFLGM